MIVNLESYCVKEIKDENAEYFASARIRPESNDVSLLDVQSFRSPTEISE